ncbi:hypothetical protein RclHR1_10470013 [Rhizophagus clarus]|uniref:Uncharacterized protein n=1 Tax=Rhizophagus clarus TaxID=94130 RepID=A0A2Z6QSV8_9GLOM|nr:hypothetical protein RclHR1_10470013 [Rhizophagus clarus]
MSSQGHCICRNKYLSLICGLKNFLKKIHIISYENHGNRRPSVSLITIEDSEPINVNNTKINEVVHSDRE